MNKTGLVAKKILVRAKGKTVRRTYWVKPEESSSSDLVRLRRAQEFKDEAPRQDEAPKTEKVQVFVEPPYKQRKQGQEPVPHVKPPEIQLPRRPLDFSMVGSEGVTAANMKEVMAANQDSLIALGSSLDSAFGGGKGTTRIDAVPDRMMTMVLGASVQGAYNPKNGEMMLRGSIVTKMMTPALKQQGANEDERLATQIWTHEQLHASSNVKRPEGEPLTEASQPNRWIEEATTELLSHHYNSQVVTALTGQPARKTDPLTYELDIFDGGVQLEPHLGVAYRAQVMKFTNLAGYIGGLTTSDSLDTVNRVVLGYAAEVKKRGADRYEYLADEVLKAHKITHEEPERYEASKKALIQGLKTYMGTPTISSMYGESLSSVQGVVSVALTEGAKEAEKVKQEKKASAPTVVTPLAIAEPKDPPKPAKRAGPRNTLKHKL